MLARFALSISQHCLASSKSKPRYRICTIFGAPDQFENMPQGIRTGIEPLRQEARLSGPALCQLLKHPAEEPTQVHNQTCSLRATPACYPFASLVLCI